MEAYQELETKFSEAMAVENVVACSSGTAALHLALEALCIPKGSKVLIPDFTMIACARACSLAGLEVVTIDCDDNLLMNIDLITKLPYNTSTIMPVHIYGRRCNMDRIVQFANKHDLYIIEDMAEAHGIEPHPSTDATCWSFYKNKIVCGEEGGAVSFRIEEPAIVARSLRSLGFTDSHDFSHIPYGHNYRLANLLARPIVKSLEELPINLLKRNVIACIYDEYTPKRWWMPRRDVVWVYDFRIPGLTSINQDQIVAALNREGIKARHGFKPIYRQEEYSSCYTFNKGNSALLSKEVIYLPIDPDILNPQGEINTAMEIIQQIADKCY